MSEHFETDVALLSIGMFQPKMDLDRKWESARRNDRHSDKVKGPGSMLSQRTHEASSQISPAMGSLGLADLAALEPKNKFHV